MARRPTLRPGRPAPDRHRRKRARRRPAGCNRDLGAAYNLTVDDIHTYYVLAGTTPVLVHNCGGPWKLARITLSPIKMATRPPCPPCVSGSGRMRRRSRPPQTNMDLRTSVV
ncbi:hypothetical protein AAH979_32675 [Plantactinospora sp. ZYX-F-223]|uniref:hypothetical protein n=1 Tax=Plantactinospora sp. ZYX-F-223 TaxID=3144103 RepID=UPI0031FC8A84